MYNKKITKQKKKLSKKNPHLIKKKLQKNPVFRYIAYKSHTHNRFK